jgi:phosphoribosyl 1,2-cyclic phosphodiesterase
MLIDTPCSMTSPPASNSASFDDESSPESLGMCVLGSGSGGNSTVIRCGGAAMLVDAGFGPVTTAKRLGQAGLKLGDIKAICLTHLDQDHFRPHWPRTLLGWGINVFVHRWHCDKLKQLAGVAAMVEAGLVHVFDDEPFQPLGPGNDLSVQAMRLIHDTQGTCGFHIDAGAAGRIGYATDLGHVPAALIERFTDVDLLALESNYDPPMQARSGRPLFLQRRIMGHAGHLSNEQAFDAISRIVTRSSPGRPQHIVLLHRSAQCNSQACIDQVFAQSPPIHQRLCLAEPRRRSRWLTAQPLPAVNRQQFQLWS